MKFRIITAMYNVDCWIEKSINIIQAQTYENFECVLIDDMSTDGTIETAMRAIDGDPRFRLIVNKEKKFKTRNVVEGIENSGATSEDVILLVDGDDRLAHRGVLNKVMDVYLSTGCWMTYGSYCNHRGVRDVVSQPYKQHIVSKNQFRRYKWLASHLKTFKYKLWRMLDMDVFQLSDSEYKQAMLRALLKGHLRAWSKWRNIARSDLLDSTGRYIRRCDDKAFSYPMLEMAGDKAAFIEEILYVYGLEQSDDRSMQPVYGVGKNEKWHTRLIRDVIVHKSSYPRLKATAI